MLTFDIPGFKPLRLGHLVLDYNGTLACDGRVIDGVKDRLQTLAHDLRLHVITADTFGTVRQALQGTPCEIAVLPVEDQDTAKLRYVERLGPDRCACIGNGRNDRLMLKAAALGIAVMQEEGAAVEALVSADAVLPDIRAALDLLANPLRLIATLRS